MFSLRLRPHFVQSINMFSPLSMLFNFLIIRLFFSKLFKACWVTRASGSFFSILYGYSRVFVAIQTNNKDMASESESIDEKNARIQKEQKVFRKYSLQNTAGGNPRKGSANPINKRKLKTCPICQGQNKQMKRHIVRVHGLSLSSSVLADCLLATSVRQITSKPGPKKLAVCGICGASRQNIKSHLLLVHKTDDSAMINMDVSTSQSQHTGAENACVQDWLNRYRATHFSSMDGAVQSIKAKTREKAMNAKLSKLTSMLDFIVSKSGKTSLETVLASIQTLMQLPDGYFWTRKGKYINICKDIDALSEFTRYARREELITSQTATTALERLKNCRDNAKRRANVEQAEFQDRDGKITVLQKDVDEFRISRRAKEAQTTLARMTPLTKRSAVNVRNYLITELLLENFCRPSDLVGLTLSSLKRARENRGQLKEGQSYISVCTTTSKNAASSGVPAYLMITDRLDAKLKLYETEVRPKLARETSPDDMFLLTSGEAMTDDNISNGFRTIWRAAGIDNKSFKTKANSRHIRHTGCGFAKALGSPNLKQTVHIGLNHTKDAGQRSYMSQVRPHLSAEAKAEMLQLRETRSNQFHGIVQGSISHSFYKPKAAPFMQNRNIS